MTRYWFKPHRYGFGATPIAWQGWALAAVDLMIVLVAVVGLVLAGRDADFSAQAPWLLLILAATVVSVVISWWKTDGSWRWRWGKNHD
jgi:hypothetical protein